MKTAKDYIAMWVCGITLGLFFLAGFGAWEAFEAWDSRRVKQRSAEFYKQYVEKQKLEKQNG